MINVEVVNGILRGFNNIFQYCLAGFIIGNELGLACGGTTGPAQVC